jgi:hypothetical protein
MLFVSEERFDKFDPSYLNKMGRLCQICLIVLPPLPCRQWGDLVCERRRARRLSRLRFYI